MRVRGKESNFLKANGREECKVGERREITRIKN